MSVDVLIPHHNDPGGLRVSLESVARQTFRPIRVVVADDGSAPDALREVEGLIEKSGLDVHLVTNGRNLGRPRTRNVLLDMIEAPFAAWLDAGDEWYPDKVAIQIERLSQLTRVADAGNIWITCNYDWQWTGRAPVACAQAVDQDQTQEILRGRTLRAYLWTLLAPAGAYRSVGYFDEKLPRLQDVDFFLRFLRQGGTIHHAGTERSLCVYHKSDLGRDADQIRECNAYLLHKHGAIYATYGRDFINDCVFEMDLLAARYAFNNRQLAASVRYGFAAFRARPRTLITRLSKRALAVADRRLRNRSASARGS